MRAGIFAHVLREDAVQRIGDLRDTIVPFFEQNPLRTAKRQNFVKFAEIGLVVLLAAHMAGGLRLLAIIPERYRACTRIAKPYETITLRRALQQVLGPNAPD